MKRIADASTKPLRSGRGTMHRLVGPEDGAENVDLHINVIDAGARAGQRLHHHERAESIYLVLEGRAEVIIGDDREILGPDELMFIPRGARHTIGNAGETPLKIIEIYAPAGDDFHYD